MVNKYILAECMAKASIILTTEEIAEMFESRKDKLNKLDKNIQEFLLAEVDFKCIEALCKVSETFKTLATSPEAKQLWINKINEEFFEFHISFDWEKSSEDIMGIYIFHSKKLDEMRLLSSAKLSTEIENPDLADYDRLTFLTANLIKINIENLEDSDYVEKIWLPILKCIKFYATKKVGKHDKKASYMNNWDKDLAQRIFRFYHQNFPFRYHRYIQKKSKYIPYVLKCRCMVWENISDWFKRELPTLINENSQYSRLIIESFVEGYAGCILSNEEFSLFIGHFLNYHRKTGINLFKKANETVVSIPWRSNMDLVKKYISENKLKKEELEILNNFIHMGYF